MGWRAGVGGGGVHGLRIVSMVRSERHVAQGLRGARGKSIGPIIGPLRRCSRK